VASIHAKLLRAAQLCWPPASPGCQLPIPIPNPIPAPAILSAQTVDPRQLQISLTGFLEKNTSLFCKVGTGLHDGHLS